MSILSRIRPGPLNPQLSPNYLKISPQPKSSILRYQMRDLFKRCKRLTDWIKRVNDDNVDEEEPEIEQIS